MKIRTTILSLALLSSLACFGWGQKGHDVVAYIAECHLTPKTKAAVEAALDGKSMVYYANWLDNASHTPEYSYTKTWHYKNVDADKTYDTMTPNHRGDVVTALNEQIAKLQAGNLSHTDEALALKIVVHLAGDVHQPMHLGHLSDLGGNRWMVTYFGRERNLHSIWDTDLVESAHKWSYTEWQQQIDRLPAEAAAKVLGKTPDDWARETVNLATWVYATTPEGAKLSYDYVATAAEVIEQQLLFGGLRLAETLNSIYDK
ncbi:MAG: S1/P1 nuclease [Bacteroidales bacterium]|nr:S1/P1 nuclease [Bacteroidales bacterium]MDD6141458.1 S1/P1 nuclease [Bacteroidales bacterium]MDD6621966.1 S1/P1 nuclease [Bacteroidales bacterium]